LAIIAFSRCYATRAVRLLARSRGARPVLADLDQPASLQRIAVWPTSLSIWPRRRLTDEGSDRSAGVIPAPVGLLAALARGRSLPQRIVYISTSGVYGDCQGERIDETRTLASGDGARLPPS
jgi:hypothetical protein